MSSSVAAAAAGNSVVFATRRRRVALITGGAKRIGKALIHAFHGQGYNVVVHYSTSQKEALSVVHELCKVREGSAVALGCSFVDSDTVMTCSPNASNVKSDTLSVRCLRLMQEAHSAFGAVDVLVNSASSFYPTPLRPQRTATTTTCTGRDDDDSSCSSDTTIKAATLETQWAELMGSNAKAPWLLTKAFAALPPSSPTSSSDTVACDGTFGGSSSNRCIINITDAMLHRPLTEHTVYLMAKHALHGLTLSSAIDLAPLNIRVNAIAPGYNVFPDVGFCDVLADSMRKEVPLGGREGSPSDVTSLALFLASDEASYMTGQTLNIDGGLSLRRHQHT